MSVPSVSKIQSNTSFSPESIKTNLRALTKAGEKVAVVAVHLLLAVAHSVVAAPLALFSGNSRRAELHFECAKIALYSLYSYSLPRKNPYSGEFRFHHISFGLFCALLPGRLHEFGKWMTFDSVVNYDEFSIFKRREGYFVDRTFLLKQGISDGILQQIAAVVIQDGAVQVRESVFPADNFFVRHHITFLKELFMPWKASPYLDAAIAKKNEIIEAFVLPEVERIKSSPERRQPKITIDFSLFG